MFLLFRCPNRMLATVANVLDDLPSTTVLIKILHKIRFVFIINSHSHSQYYKYLHNYQHFLYFILFLMINVIIEKRYLTLLLQIFDVIDEEISSAVKKRYHSCVLAYGQSATGKTHTMMGNLHDPGITPRLCNNIFNYLEDIIANNGENIDAKTCARY